MERYTYWCDDGKGGGEWRVNTICGKEQRGPHIDRLASIEDILGDDYDLDRLRELVEADQDGRCLVLPAMREIFYRTMALATKRTTERGTGQVNKPEIIRGLVDGERKYCRIPIRRKRIPIYAYELEDIMKKYTNKEGFVDIESIQNDATELFQNQNYREAGILCSVIDFIEFFSRCTVFTD